MKDTIAKLNKIRDEILHEKKGVLHLFALIARVDIEGKSDLLLSADWVEKNNAETDLVYVIEKLKSEFESNLEFLSKIVLLTPDQPFIKQLAKAVYRENQGQPGELNDLNISGDFVVKKVNIIAIEFNPSDLETDVEEGGVPEAVGHVAEF